MNVTQILAGVIVIAGCIAGLWSLRHGDPDGGAFQRNNWLRVPAILVMLIVILISVLVIAGATSWFNYRLCLETDAGSTICFGDADGLTWDELPAGQNESHRGGDD